MELNSTFTQNFEKFSESYNFKLIEFSFLFFDSNVKKEQYEDDVEQFIAEYKEYKPNETKFNLKFLIDFIEKNLNTEDSLLEEFLNGLSILDFNFINETK